MSLLYFGQRIQPLGILATAEGYYVCDYSEDAIWASLRDPGGEFWETILDHDEYEVLDEVNPDYYLTEAGDED